MKLTAHVITVFCFIIFLTMPRLAFSQGVSFGIAQYYPVQAEKVEDGAVVAATDKGYELCHDEYSPLIVGVVSFNPAMSLKGVEIASDEYPVISNGKAYVLVNGFGGEIHKGDLLTGSTQAGVAMKATEGGFVIGSALEDYIPSHPEQQGKILMLLNLHFSIQGGDMYHSEPSTLTERLAQIYNLSALAAYEKPSTVLKYVLSGLIVVVSIVFSFFTFARVAKNGIEAFGRNPLAAKFIGIGMVLNVFIAVAIVGSGLGVAYLILVL